MSAARSKRAVVAVRCSSCGAEAKAARTAREAYQKARSAGWARQVGGEGWRCSQCRAPEIRRGPDNAAAGTAVRLAAVPVPAEQHDTEKQ